MFCLVEAEVFASAPPRCGARATMKLSGFSYMAALLAFRSGKINTSHLLQSLPKRGFAKK